MSRYKNETNYLDQTFLAGWEWTLTKDPFSQEGWSGSGCGCGGNSIKRPCMPRYTRRRLSTDKDGLFGHLKV